MSEDIHALMKRNHQNTAFVFSLMDFVFGFLWIGSSVHGMGFFGLVIGMICLGFAVYFLWHSVD